MMVHYYKRLLDENGSLKNDNNTLKTYVSAYEKQRSNSASGAVLLALSNISIGFGVNLLTGTNSNSGWSALATGVVIAAGGLYFSFFKDRG
jgi:hypothetical protein